MNWNEYFRYDDATGDLFWKARPLSHFVDERAMRVWNTRYSHKRAGTTKSSNGRVMIAIKTQGVQKLCCAHRIIWEMHHGPIPKRMVIDHVNRNYADNRLVNLRVCSHAQNLWNRGVQNGPVRGSKSRLKGVMWSARNNKWAAIMRRNGKQIYLGLHETKGLAAVAHAKAAIRYHGEFARINNSKSLIKRNNHDRPQNHLPS